MIAKGLSMKSLTTFLVCWRNAFFKDFTFQVLINPHCFINWQNNVPVDKQALLRMKYDLLFRITLLEQQLLYIHRDQWRLVVFFTGGGKSLKNWVWSKISQGATP